MQNDEQNDEIVLSSGAYRAITSTYGASLRRLWTVTANGARDLIWGYRGTSSKKGGQGDVLIPFPGRIASGKYSVSGRSYQLEKNDKEGPNAIHGFVRNRKWQVRSSVSEAEFTVAVTQEELEAKGYPFSLSISVKYSLSAEGLTCEHRVTNTGASTAPVGAGFHPYFTVGTDPVDSSLVSIPARKVLEFDSNLLPTGRILPVDGTPLDYRQSHPLGTLRLNHCYADLIRDSRGLARVSMRHPESNAALELWMDESFPYLVAYTGDALGPLARKALALEPMTCATDAFNRPEWGLILLEPGATTTGRWGVQATT